MARKRKAPEESIEIEIESPEPRKESQPAKIIEISEDMYDTRIKAVEEKLLKLKLKEPCYSECLPEDESWRLYWGLPSKEDNLTLMAAQRNGQLICLSDAPRYLKRAAMKVLEDMLTKARLKSEKEKKRKKKK